MGAMAFDGGGEAYYGADYGVWANNGIVPQITTAQSGQVIIQGVLSGELDIGIAKFIQHCDCNCAKHTDRDDRTRRRLFQQGFNSESGRLPKTGQSSLQKI